jgi:hypothetical protein
MLAAGTRLGVFEILGLLGAGGMGEVYRARDTTLRREVALKILPDAFAADTDRLARFRREAQLLAALNHPNIAAIHGLQESDGVCALVLELVEGPTLGDWIATRSRRERRDGATTGVHSQEIGVARQIAEALDAAHERGIVHRDLKPANVKIAADGRVKVLDFGIAKLQEPVGATAGTELRSDNALHTVNGVVLGTVPYMSPEQARGVAVDRRADIWAFGCVLYELLTGRQAFPSGETASDTLARVLALDPDWSELPSATPPRLRALLERCLRKDPRQRLRDIGDALLDLDEIAQLKSRVAAPAAASRRREFAWAAVAVLALAVAGVVGVMARRAPALDASPVAFTVEAPKRGPMAVGQPLSPDGQTVAFVAEDADGARKIFTRRLDSPTAEPLEGTAGAAEPFWSPDSQHLAFLADGRLKRVPTAGGAVQMIAAIAGLEGASWGSEGVILLGGRGPLLQVAASGGELMAATTIDAAAGDQWHTAPEFLPDGRTFLYTVRSGGLANFQTYVGSLDSSERRPLAGVRSAARYSSTGHVLFTRDGSLVAQGFDVERRSLVGEPFLVAERVAGGVEAPFTISASGSLAYLAMPDQLTELGWFDRTGMRLGTTGPRGVYLNPELSPDGQRLALDLDVEGNIDVWTRDLVSGIAIRVTNHGAAEYSPIWSPDGRTLGFTSYRGALGQLYRRDVDVVAEDTLIQDSTAEQQLSDWSSDGRYLLYLQLDSVGEGRPLAEDLWALELDDTPARIRLTNTVFSELNPRLSPDGQWVAYESNESGRLEIYVQAFPGPGRRQPVSAGGGRTARWKPDGTELYYLTPSGDVMAVPVVASAGAFPFGAPTRLFGANVEFTPGLGRVLNVSADGRFLLKVVPDDRVPPPIVVLHDWATQLPR